MEQIGREEGLSYDEVKSILVMSVLSKPVGSQSNE
jgi:hypothetical protein